MTKSVQILALLALLIVAAACSLFKKDIDVPQEFSLYIDRTEASTPEFSVSEEVDTRDADIEKYKSDIDEFKIDKLTFTVSNFSGASAAAVSGTLKFAASGSSNYKTLGNISNVNMAALAANGQEMSVTVTDATAKNELIALMKGGNLIDFKLDGTTSEIPVAASLNFKIYANMTVEL